MTAMNKPQLRAYLRSLHEGREARDVQSEALCRHILNSAAYQEARIVGGYMPMLREANIMPVLTDVLKAGKILALPLCDEPPVMTLRMVASLNDLAPGAYGIIEPRRDAPVIPAQEVDFLLVPLEGVDQDGFRLGKGGGYYDRLLANGDVTAIGCALSWQWVKTIPREPWDKPLSACADANGLHVFKR